MRLEIDTNDLLEAMILGFAMQDMRRQGLLDQALLSAITSYFLGAQKRGRSGNSRAAPAQNPLQKYGGIDIDRLANISNTFGQHRDVEGSPRPRPRSGAEAALVV